MKRIIIIGITLLTILGYIYLDNNLYHKEQGHLVDYKYKNIDGHAYKRQYDFTNHQWLSDWEKI